MVAPLGCDQRITQSVAEGAQKTYYFGTLGAPKVAEWDGRDENQTIVASGVYKVRLTIRDGVGNASEVEIAVGEKVRPLADEKTEPLTDKMAWSSIAK